MPMNSRLIVLILFFGFLPLACMAQTPSFKQGFDAAEYEDLLRINFMIGKDTSLNNFTMGRQHTYRFRHRSRELGLKNLFEIWLRDDNTAVLSIRGTVPHASSWLENFYSAMVPASGTIKISPDTVFNYKLSEDPKAAVHAGWAVGLAHMAPFMTAELSGLITSGKVSNLIVVGHSQGGALAFLASSYLYYLSADKKLPSKINIKTYCSAAPKPGNLYYAYDFDHIMRNGMAFTVVNAADWVPESPATEQTFGDINPVNPFYNAHTLLGKQKWPANWYLNSVYKKLKKSPNKSMRRYEKYFGHKIFTLVHENLPGLQEPDYAGTFNYMRAGIPIVLMPDSAYYKKYPNDQSNVFIHHMLEPYLHLLKKDYGN